MMGARQVAREAFYEFSLEGHVPAGHVLRAIDGFVDRAPFLTVYLLAATPAMPETSREAAEFAAARHARTCYVEMMDGQLKCGGRPRRPFAAARALLGPGSLAKTEEPSTCKAGKQIWVFRWRGFPDQAPIAVDAETGKLIECRP